MVTVLNSKSNAQVSLTGPYSQDFNTLVSSGSSTVLPTGWLLFETGTAANTSYTAGTGSLATGDCYSFGSAALPGDRALGGLLSGSLVPTLGAAFTNNTLNSIGSLTIAYTGEQWRIGALGRLDKLTFEYSTNATSLTTGTWIAVTNLDFIAPNTTSAIGLLDGNIAPTNRTSISFTLTGLSISNGSTFYLRWSDFNPSGSDDGLGIDDFSMTYTSPCVSPVVSCPANISTANAPGQCGANVSYTATSTGTSPSITYSPLSGSFFPIGTTTVLVTATNGCGTSACSFTVTVNSPEIDITGNSVSIVDGDASPALTDHTDFGNATIGGNVVRTFTILNSGTNPLNISTLNSSNALFAVGSLTPAGAIAAGGSATYTVTFSPAVAGLETATITATNDDCNESIYDFAIQGNGVTSCVPPVISCPANISVSNSPGQCGAIVNYSATASGSPAPSITYSIAPGSFFSTGTVTVTATATNSCGTDNCTFTVTVTDTEVPSISCPSNIVGVVATGPTGAVVNYTAPVGTDNCVGASTILFSGLASGSTFPIGTSTVTYRVTDAVGLTASCSFTVNVIGAAPVVVCPGNISVPSTAGLCGANVSYVATDVVGVPASTISYSIAPGSFFAVGAPTTVTATATNVVGTSSCNFTVTVTDNQPPTAICQNATVILNASGTGSVTVAQINNGSSDNCTIAGMNVTPNTFNCSNVVNVTTPTDLFISEYIEGSSNNKSIEIYNGTGSPVNLTTGGYQLRVYANGSSTAAAPISLTGTIAAGDVYVVSNNAANAGILAQTDLTSGSVSFNGDDAVALTKNGATGTFVDIFGSIGTDPGTAWTSGSFSTLDKTLRRISTISQGITTNPASAFPQLGTEWVQANTDDISGLGAHSITMGTPVTLTVTDVNGNSSSCVANVTVVDNTPPTVICQNATVVLDANGNGTLLISQVNNGSSDNCSIASMSVSPNTFTCANIGTPVTVTLTVVDVNGNSNSCTSTVTIVDNAPPVAICQNATVILNASGTGTLTTAQVNNGSTDNCSIAGMTVTPNTFNCANIVNVVAPTDLFISEYIEGSSNNKSIEIYNGTGSPVNLTAGGYQLRVYANGSSTAAAPISLTGTIAAGDVYVVSNNAASAGILAQTDVTSGSVSFNGDDAVALTKNGATGTFVDIFGSIGTDPGTAWTSGSFTTLDRTLRRASNISQGVTTNPGSSFPQLASEWVQSATDDITGLGSHSLAAGNLVTLTVTDASGNIATCTANVTVVDNIPPIAVCQNATVILDASGNGTLTTAQVNNGSTDNCSIASMSVSPNTFTCANVGTPVTVTLTVIDASGLSSTCTSTVTVIDNLPPVAICQNATVVLDAFGNGTVTAAQINNGSTDNCTIASMSVTPNTFNCASISGGSAPTDLFISEYIEGSSNNKCIEIFNGTGAAVNLATGGYQLQYYFNGALSSGLTIALTGTIAAGDVYVVCQSTSAAQFLSQADQTNASSWYNGDDAIVLTKNSGAVTVDIFGRIGEDPGASWGVSPLVTVDKTLRRNSNVISGVTTNPASGFPTLATQWTSFLIDDATGLGTHAITGGSGSSVVPVVLTVTDNHGNSSTCNANVTVVDNTPPTAVCQSITVALNASGTASITAAQINNGSNDACGIASSSVSPSSFNCNNLGANTVTLTVTDVNGNSATCTATVTVIDNTAPIVNCQNVTVVLDANGNGVVTTAQVNNGSTDNCAITNMSISPTTFNCSNVGSGVIPTDLFISEYIEGSSNNKCIEIYNGTGSAINLSTGGYQLQVYSNGSTSPTNINLTGIINPGQVFVVCNPSAAAAFLAQADQTSGSASFNGDDAVALYKSSTGQLLDIFGTIGEDPGTTWTSGLNQTLDRTLRRNASVLNGVTVNPPTGFPTLSSEWTVFPTDNSSDLGSHSILPSGNVITLTATDASGNTSTCMATVTVIDNTAPVANCQPLTIQLDANGTASITASQLNNGSTDACGGLTFSASKTSFDCSNLGANQVVLTVTDANSNSATCTTTVTVQDLISPTLTCPANISVNNTTGMCGAIVNYSTPSGSDNCSTTVTQLTGLASGASFPVGTTVNTFKITDAAGNFTTCSFSVSVTDTEDPVITNCPANFSACNPITWITPNVSDNCAGVQLSSTHTPGSIFPAGTTTVTYTATDAYNNVATCSFTVTRLEESAPATSITSNRDFNNICSGDNVTLTINGGTLGTGANWKWYTGTCGGVALPAFTGMSSITVSPAVTTTYFARAEGQCNNSTCVSITIVVSTSVPGAVTITSMPPYGAVGVTGIITCSPVAGATFYRWTSNLGHINAVWFNGSQGPVETSSNSVNVSFQLAQQNYQIRVVAGNACGRSNNAAAHIRGTVPASTCLSGPIQACPNTNATYSVAACPISGTNSYQWSVTGNATITSGQGTPTITVNFGGNFTNATVCVNGVTNFGLAGPQTCLNVSNTTATPGTITGNNQPCSLSVQSYTISPIAGASSYVWTTNIPGATISGTSTTGIVTYPISTFNGQVCVASVSGCGTSAPSCLNITSGAPGIPGPISGPLAGICGASNVNYALATNDANSYSWTFPAGSVVNSGGASNSVNVTFPVGMIGPQTIIVTAYYNCGNATSSIVVNGAPAVPSVTPATICVNSDELYFASSAGADSYNWITTGSTYEECTNGVNFCSQYYVVWGGGGTLSVTATNTCGTSAPFSFGTNCRISGGGNMDTKVYPNPTDGNLTIEFSSYEGGQFNLTVTDLEGRSILIKDLNAISGLNQHSIDLGFVNPGLYVLYLRNESGAISVSKITVE